MGSPGCASTTQASGITTPAREFEVASRRSLELAKDAIWREKRTLDQAA
jgi:hypothetical protein